MEFKLRGGDYALNVFGGVETLSGVSEILQRVLLKLSVQRGSFLPMPEFGSELYKLCGMKKSERASLARQFVHEALCDEAEISVSGVSYDEEGDVGLVRVFFEINGEREPQALTFRLGGV